MPDEDIAIKFIGLRHGEKLVEELVGDGETLEPSEISKIFRVRWPETSDATQLIEEVEALAQSAMHGQERRNDCPASPHRPDLHPTRPCARKGG